MRRVRTIISGGLLSMLTVVGTWAASNPQSVVDGTTSILHLATVGYVDRGMKVIADSLSTQSGQISALSNMVADQMISNLEAQLEIAKGKWLDAENDLAANPNVRTLQMDVKDAKQKFDDLTEQLVRNRCYRGAVISGQEHAAEGCRVVQ